MTQNRRSRFISMAVAFTLIATTMISIADVGYDFSTISNEPVKATFSTGLGHQFYPTTGVNITKLGFCCWAETGSIPASNPITVQLYKIGHSTPLATLIFDENDTASSTFDPGPVGGDIVSIFTKELSVPLSLPLKPYVEYMIVVYGYNDTVGKKVQYFQSPSVVTMGGAITHVNRYYGSVGINSRPACS